MKKEKGKRRREKAAGCLDTSPLARSHSATGFSPQSRKPPNSKCPPLRGTMGGKQRNKPLKNPDYWPLADFADVRRKKIRANPRDLRAE